MTRILFLSIFLFQFLVGYAQKATVSGVCLPCSGTMVKLVVYDDLISQRESIVSESEVDAAGNFSLPFDFREERYAWVEAGKIRYDFFLEPSKDLKIEFDLVVPDQQEVELGIGKYYNLIPEFINSPGADLNRKIQKFNDEFSRFLESQYQLIALRKAPSAVGKAVKEFKHRMDSIHQKETGFFRDHVKYAIASVELSSKRKKELMFNDYLKGQRMLFHNWEFMSFFGQFHAEGLEQQARYSKASEFKKAFEMREPDGEVLSILMKDPYLQDVIQRQAFYIIGLGSLANSGLYDRKKVLAMLKRFGMFSSNSELGKAAKNLHWKHMRFLTGEKAPVFFANTIDGDLVSDRTFKNGFVVMEFGMVGNSMSERETAILPSMMQDYPDIQLISFMVNESREPVRSFKQKYGLSWPVVRISEDSKIIDDYDLRSLPFYVILDGDWKFVKYGANEPSRGLEKDLYRIQELLKDPYRSKIGEK